MDVRPTGTVTFLFTDVEGSTRRWERDATRADALIADHDVVLVDTLVRHNGYVFSHGGDGFAAAFSRASDAVAAAAEAQTTLGGGRFAAEELRVRIGMHTGEAVERDGDYFGPTVNRAARIMAAGHGGQVLMSSVTMRLAAGTRTLGLGEHALDGVDERLEIHQLLIDGVRESFPPLRTPTSSTNLPHVLTRFVGRQDELTTVSALLGEGRLVTLIGTGGAGKTRLGIEAARASSPAFGDGVWFAGLVDVDDAALLASSVAQSLGRHDPLSGGATTSVRAHLAQSIGDAHALVLLDNCEHLRSACAELVGYLLERCPRLVFLATSREALGVLGERLVEVGSLDMPSGDDVSSVVASAAGALFLERARLVRPEFDVTAANSASVAALCRRLAGLPLALELAAARSRVLTPSDLLDRLDGAFAVLGTARTHAKHHETLRATLVWSYELLRDSEQGLFRKLAVFRGGFGLGAAEAVSDELDRLGVLDDLAALVDKSVVGVVRDDDAGSRRFQLLEVVREFALDLLMESGERAETERRHRGYLRHACTELSELDRGLPRFTAMSSELDNVRAVVAWALDSGEAADVLEIISEYPMWQDLGLLREQVQLLGAALASIHEDVALETMQRALVNLSINVTYLGDQAAAQAAADQLATLASQHPHDLNLRGGVAFALATLEYFFAGHDLEAAHTRMSEVQACQDDLGEPNGYPAGNQVIATVCFEVEPANGLQSAAADGLSRARVANSPVIALTIETLMSAHRVLHGDPTAHEACETYYRDLLATGSGWEGHLLSYIVGLVREELGDERGAADAYLDYVRYFRASGLHVFLAGAVCATARLCAERHPEQAVRLWAAAQRIEETTGMRRIAVHANRDDRLRHRTRERLVDQERRAGEDEVRAWTLPHLIDAAEAELTAVSTS